MARTLEGTKSLKTTKAKAPAKQDLRILRCPRCKANARPASDGKGGMVSQCPSCGGSFSSKAI